MRPILRPPAGWGFRNFRAAFAHPFDPSGVPRQQAGHDLEAHSERALRSWSRLTTTHLSEYFVLFKDLLSREFNPVKKIVIETINGEPAMKSPYQEPLKQIRVPFGEECAGDVAGTMRTKV